jgi:hypothetical protein
MEILSKHSAVTQRNLRYLMACLLTGLATASVLGCANDADDDKQASSAESKTSDDKDSKNDSDDKASSEKDATTSVEEFRPMASAEQEAASKSQMRYDGSWRGTTSQDKPVTFKILNRFLAHIEVTYALEGDGCKAEDKTVKISAMNGLRSAGFAVMNTSETEKLMVSGMITGDTESSGTFTVEAVGDAPQGCNANLSGTWTATK